MKLSDQIIDYRAKHNLSQKKMADMCGVTTITLGNIERGLQSPSRLTEAKINQVLGKDGNNYESINIEN